MTGQKFKFGIRCARADYGDVQITLYRVFGKAPHKGHIVLVGGEISENTKVGKGLVHYTDNVRLVVIVFRIVGIIFIVRVLHYAVYIVFDFVGIVVIRLRHIHIFCIAEEIKGKAVVVIAPRLVPEVGSNPHIGENACKIKEN